MNILITGAKGFVGKNLVEALKNVKFGKDKSRGITEDIDIFEYDIDTDKSLLDEYSKKADFVFNLAGVNRPENEEDFMNGNFPRKYNKNNGYIDYNGTSGMWKIFPGTLKEFNEWSGNSNYLIDSLKHELDTLKRPLTHVQYERIKQILMDA